MSFAANLHPRSTHSSKQSSDSLGRSDSDLCPIGDKEKVGHVGAACSREIATGATEWLGIGLSQASGDRRFVLQ